MLQSVITFYAKQCLKKLFYIYRPTENQMGKCESVLTVDHSLFTFDFLTGEKCKSSILKEKFKDISYKSTPLQLEVPLQIVFTK